MKVFVRNTEDHYTFTDVLGAAINENKAKKKVSELTGVQLDWVVAKCEGQALLDPHNNEWEYCWNLLGDNSGDYYSPSTNWEQGGSLIQRERMEVMPCMDGITWEVRRFISECELFVAYGSTPLIAAMRCFCCSKLGDVVDIPKEFSN